MSLRVDLWRSSFVLLVAACSRAPAPASPPADLRPSSARVTWVKVRNAAEARLLEAPAQILPAPGGSAALTPPLAARLIAFRVRVGDRVSANAVIAEVLMPDAVAAAGKLVAARTRLAASSERLRALDELAKEGLSRLADRIEVQGQVADARAEEQLATATLAAAGLRASDASRLLDEQGRVGLRAPFAGVVTELDGEVGEQRPAGGKPFAHLVDLRALRIEAHFTQAIAPDGRAVFVDAQGAEHEVVWASRALVPDTVGGTFLGFFELPSTGTWPPGSFGRIRLAPSAPWLLVPATAISLQGEVHRKSGERVRVQIIARSGAEAVVAAPSLSAGDEVSDSPDERAP